MKVKQTVTTKFYTAYTGWNSLEFTDENGEAILRWKIPRRQAAGTYTTRVTTTIKNGFEYQLGVGVESVSFVIQ